MPEHNLVHGNLDNVTPERGANTTLQLKDDEPRARV